LRAIDGEKMITISFDDLTVKAQYYILVSGKNIEPGAQFNLHVLPEYTQQTVPQPSQEPAEAKTERLIYGRVLDEKNNPLSGVLVSLLDQRMRPLESAKIVELGLRF
jgi:hypothetical protein